ncbi:hypothetical protein APHAL10511_004047 [Amanita phalloides]|nr:hypothetical protein APHAL10511_004047 [Amanita phalloides]
MPYPCSRVTSAASQSCWQEQQVRQHSSSIDSGPDGSIEDKPFLDTPPSPTRTLIEHDTMLDIDKGEQSCDNANFANDNFPPSGQLPIDLNDWNEPPEPEYEPDVQGEEGNNGHCEEQDGAEHEDEPPHPQPPPQPNQGKLLPQATYPMLMLAQQMVDSIKNATLEDDIHDPKLLHSIQHPPSENELVDQKTTLSLCIFLGLVGGSEKMYQNVQEALHLSDLLWPIHSYEVIHTKVECLTGIAQIQTDMCINSCIAYTGPFESLDACPKCTMSQYEHPLTTSQ